MAEIFAAAGLLREGVMDSLRREGRKLCITSTVSRVLKYIPELQRQVKQLQRKKEEILSKVPFITAAGKIIATYAISALYLSEKKIRVQICMIFD
ncbi:Transcription factor ORG3 [Platanthera guangdongensis]|uniref:Transcription factor ORG3 n=1 Tax=Platanthera guangdongensis TaxID=2320717 RepID=A0ABR2MJK2_9ASPA